MMADWVQAEGEARAGAFVILCDHASNRIPSHLGMLGLDNLYRADHVAWDIGALELSRLLAERLDAPLVFPLVSRLVVDCNRAPGHKDLMVCETEIGPVPANKSLAPEDRDWRMVAIHAAYHSKIEMLLAARSARNLPTNLVALHSFTPVLQKQIRPWHAGIIFEQDKIAQRLIAALRRETWLVVGENEPYSAAQGVYYTIARHEKQLHRPGVMVEIRNDLIRDAAGQIQWADRLSDALLEAYGVDMSSRKRIAEVSQP